MLERWLRETDDDFADSATMAERYMKGRHVGRAMPVSPLEPVIQAGQEALADRTY
jgi:hypothetical protein